MSAEAGNVTPLPLGSWDSSSSLPLLRHTTVYIQSNIYPILSYPSMAPSYRPYSAEYGNAVVPYGGERKQVGRWVPGLWCLSDPEMKRRRRVAGYKSYAVEGKVKASIRRGLRWIKAKCSHIVHR
ncbi:hypothetical protein E2562_026623 [Oryza meyeriana var. granulata]|uniref:DUF3511 domain-containing protein n=1 Tax=Oryza meyeriana var. granulata TaxID=110450 RepID=A0A6G1D9Z6_9ORYZ|nr:hypothetical protein E2562_026623 [Oryza meyeriana var. granulata]